MPEFIKGYGVLIRTDTILIPKFYNIYNNMRSSLELSHSAPVRAAAGGAAVPPLHAAVDGTAYTRCIHYDCRHRATEGECKGNNYYKLKKYSLALWDPPIRRCDICLAGQSPTVDVGRSYIVRFDEHYQSVLIFTRSVRLSQRICTIVTSNSCLQLA